MTPERALGLSLLCACAGPAPEAARHDTAPGGQCDHLTGGVLLSLDDIEAELQPHHRPRTGDDTIEARLDVVIADAAEPSLQLTAPTPVGAGEGVFTEAFTGPLNCRAWEHFDYSGAVVTRKEVEVYQHEGDGPIALAAVPVSLTDPTFDEAHGCEDQLKDRFYISPVYGTVTVAARHAADPAAPDGADLEITRFWGQALLWTPHCRADQSITYGTVTWEPG